MGERLRGSEDESLGPLDPQHCSKTLSVKPPGDKGKLDPNRVLAGV